HTRFSRDWSSDVCSSDLETFRLTTKLGDDAGLRRYRIERLNRDGSRVLEHETNLLTQCPDPLTTHVPKQAVEVLFNQAEPTEYELTLEDTTGQIARHSFLVHPLNNVAPEIRITAPADQQYIVAGTYRIKVGVVASDVRCLSSEQVQLFANGVKLQRVQSLPEAPGGADVITQAFNE